jgi:HEAT repeat protein
MRIAPCGSPDDWFLWLIGSDSRLRKQATLILGGLEPTDDVSVAPFLERLSHNDETIVFWAVVALHRLGPRSKQAASSLATIAGTHPAFGVRQAAISALPKIAPTEPGTLEAMRKALSDSAAYVRREALQAIAKLPTLEMSDLEAIARMANDADEAVARWSEIALRNIRLAGTSLH